MSDSSPLEIKVVYDATGKRSGKVVTVDAPRKKKSHPGKKRAAEEDQPTDAAPEKSGVLDLDAGAARDDTGGGETSGKKPEKKPAVIRRRSKATARRAGSRGPSVILSLMTLTVTAGLVFASWWYVEKYVIRPNVALRTPVIPPEQVNQIAKALGIAPEEQEVSTATFKGDTARNIIVASTVGWLGMTTISCCLLGLASGTGFGSVSRSMRTLGGVLFVLGLAGCGFLAWTWWQKHGLQDFQPDHARIGVAALVAMFFLFGILYGRSARAMNRRAAIFLVVAAVVSVVAICLGALSGALDDSYRQLKFLGMVFMIHSCWGWMMLIFGRRLPA